jgi:protein TonB
MRTRTYGWAAVMAFGVLAGCATTTERQIAKPDCTKPAPVYPSQSRRMGETGTVMVRASLSAEGKFTFVGVEKSSGSPRLDASAVAAVKAMSCAPARYVDTGETLAVSFGQPISFKLD